MNSRKNGRPEVSRELVEATQFLQLLEVILEGETDGSQKRRKLVQYCEGRGIEESRMWREAAVYKLYGFAGEPSYDPERYVGFFDHSRQKLRTRIVELIGKLPQEILPDFTALLDFRRQFLQRLEYVSDLLVYFFLEREKGLWRESQDTRVYTTFFDHKLFREFNVINEIVADSDGLEQLHTRYRDWLLDQALDEEAPV